MSAKYPSAVPTTTDLPTKVDDVDWIYAADVNTLRDEIIAICTELGVLPKGSYATVKARLDALGSQFGARVDKTTNWGSVVTAATDGIVYAWIDAVDEPTQLEGKVGAVAIPTNYAARLTVPDGELGSITFPVKKGEYWKVQTSHTPGDYQCWWTPTGS